MAPQVQEFQEPILDVEGSNGMLFQITDRPHISTRNYGLLKSQVSRDMGWQERHVARPPRSPDFTPLEMFFWEYIKDSVYVPPLATVLPELAGCITQTVATFILDLLSNVRPEAEYRYDICLAPLSAHIEYLYNICHKNSII
jgi:hypothetical protein